MTDSREIATAYDRWSESYDAQTNATRDLDELVLRRVIPDLAGQTVVECGCGTGKNSAWLAPRCERLAGLDFSAGMLRVAKSKVKSRNALFVLADLTEPWPVASNVAGVVLFNLVLEHIDDLRLVFREAARVLRPNGKMALSEYHPSRVSDGKGPVVLDEDGSVIHRIPNFLHTLDDYEEAARGCGLNLLSSAEWSDAELGYRHETGEGRESVPQLLSLVFEKS